MEKDQRQSALILTILVLAALMCGGTYYFTKLHYVDVENSKWQAGYNKGHEDGLAEVGPRIADDETKLADLNNKYNSLVTDYNNLRDAAIKYMGVSRYQSRQPISCTSYSYGIGNAYTSTNCY